MKQHQGQSMIELIVALGLFAVLAAGLVLAYLDAHITGRQGVEESQATFLAREGLEAVRSIRNNQWNDLTNGSHGLTKQNGYWEFAGISEPGLLGKFSRTIEIADAARDGGGNLVESGGSVDTETKAATATVSWMLSSGRSRSLSLATYITRWKQVIRNGILVYGDGGTTSDAVKYKIFNGSTGTWSSALPVADVDVGTTNKALRRAVLYASPTRNEKILVSRRLAGTNGQSIYAQVYNGDTDTWGSTRLLSSWTASTFTDVRNFDGAYLSSGVFMVVYSDNSTIPKMRTWDGTSWSAESSLPTTGGVPTYIVIRTRPGTNEVMAAFFGQAKDTNTEYYNGSTWSAATEHAINAPVTTKWLVDFAWHPEYPTKGALIYSSSGTDKTIDGKIFTADGSGGGSWSAAVQSPAQGTLGAMKVVAQPGLSQFVACDKDASRDIYCRILSTTPAWSNPTNPAIELNTDSGIQRSFGAAFESISGELAVDVHSDGTAIPKLKKYIASTATWDAAATSLPTLGAALETVRTIAAPDTDDMMIVMGNTSQDLFTIVWDGTNNAVYTTPAGKALTAHGVSGSADADYWYDFEWDGN